MAGKKKKSSVGTIIFLIITALVVIAAIVFTILDSIGYKNDPSLVGNTTGNLNNNGRVCQYEDKVFFSNPYDKGGVYVMTPDETDVKKLSNIEGWYINADSKNVFYASDEIASAKGLGGFAVPSIGIFKMSHKGDKSSNMERNGVGALRLIGNQLYYLKKVQNVGTSLYTMDINGKEEKQISDKEINPNCSAGNIIYYNAPVPDTGLYQMDLEMGNAGMVSEERMYNPDIRGQYIYFMDITDDYHICRMDLVGGTKETLENDRVDMFLLFGGKIFYLYKDGENHTGLMMMNEDGSDQRLITEGLFTDLCASDRFIYFYSYGENRVMYHIRPDGSGFEEVVAARDAALKENK